MILNSSMDFVSGELLSAKGELTPMETERRVFHMEEGIPSAVWKH